MKEGGEERLVRARGGIVVMSYVLSCVSWVRVCFCYLGGGWHERRRRRSSSWEMRHAETRAEGKASEDFADFKALVVKSKVFGYSFIGNGPFGLEA